MAKIFEGIDGYSEMSVEDKLKALEALDKADVSSEIDRYKSAASKANSEAADFKRKLNERMTESEREKAAQEEELEKLRKLVADAEKKETIASHKAQFLALGYTEEQATESASAMAESDTAKVFAGMKSFLEGHDKAFKADLIKKGSEPPVGSGKSTAVTKEAFDAMGYTERMNLKKNDPDTYRSFAK